MIVTPDTKQEVSKNEQDPRFEEYRDAFIRPLAGIFPNATREQVKQVIEVAGQWAIEKMKAEDSAGIDRLTNLPNKQGVKKLLDGRLQQYHRDLTEGGTITASVLFLDLDHFKQVNEFHSHQAGDEVLGAFGPFFAASLRPTDIIGRVGGEEFVALLDGASQEDAIRIAERIRTEVNDFFNKLFPHLNWPKTVSCGVYQLPPITAEQLRSEDSRGEIVKQFLHQADTAQLDGAKHAGKNRIGVMLPDGKIQTAFITPGIEGQPLIITYQNPHI